MPSAYAGPSYRARVSSTDGNATTTVISWSQSLPVISDASFRTVSSPPWSASVPPAVGRHSVRYRSQSVGCSRNIAYHVRDPSFSVAVPGETDGLSA